VGTGQGDERAIMVAMAQDGFRKVKLVPYNNTSNRCIFVDWNLDKRY
jgi:hypothetical protein